MNYLFSYFLTSAIKQETNKRHHSWKSGDMINICKRDDSLPQENLNEMRLEWAFEFTRFPKHFSNQL